MNRNPGVKTLLKHQAEEFVTRGVSFSQREGLREQLIDKLLAGRTGHDRTELEMASRTYEAVARAKKNCWRKTGCFGEAHRTDQRRLQKQNELRTTYDFEINY